MNFRRLLKVVVLCFFVATQPIGAAASSPGGVSESVALSSSRIAACRESNIKEKGALKVDILFVIDTSMSLRNSDPIGKTVRDPARVRAMESVISMLRRDAELEREDENVQIRVNFLDFGSKVRQSFTDGQWQSIDNFDPSDLKNFASKDDDPDTDYVGALIDRGGVIDVLTQAKNQSDCQVVLWFTDGKFDFDSKTGVGSRKFDWLEAEIGDGEVKDRVTAARALTVGEGLLCAQGTSRTSSVADDLRSLDNKGSLTVLGIGLNTSGDASNFVIMRKLLENPDCGTKKPIGYLVEVKSVDDLAEAMRKSLFPVTPVPTVCDDKRLFNEASFFIAEPVERADIFLKSRASVSKIELIQIDGNQNVLRSIPIYVDGNVGVGTSIPGVMVSTRKLDDAPTLELKLEFKVPTEKWVGQWLIRACNKENEPVQVTADVVVQGCIAFDLADGDEKIIVGRQKKIFLVLKRCGNDASRLSTVEAVSVSTTVRLGDLKIDAVLGAGESYVEIPFAPTESDLSGAKTKVVKLEVLEVDARYEVLENSRPVVLEWSKENSVFDITLRQPPSTPFIEKPIFCGILKKDSSSVVCEFTAKASEAIGRVATAGPQIESVASLGAVGITSKSSARFPLTVMPGEPKQFSFTFSIDGTRENLQTVAQPFTINFEYETDGEPTETESFESSFSVEPDFGLKPDWKRAFFFAALGLLVALSILGLARYVFARIQVPSEGMLWAGCIDLERCDPESVRVAAKSGHLEMFALPLSQKAIGLRKVNELAMVGDSNLFLQARAGWRLMSELGYVAASHPELFVVGSAGLSTRGRYGRSALNLVGEWWLVPQSLIDGIAKNSEEVRSRLEALPGKLVFVAASAEPSENFRSDLGFRIAGGLSVSLTKLAESLWIEPSAERDGEDVGSESDENPIVPNI